MKEKSIKHHLGAIEDTRGMYTIGYGSRPISRFISILQKLGIQYLIDVRSKPFSSYSPEYSTSNLKHYLRNVSIRYVWMGELLGGLPADDALYTNGRVDYDKVSLSDAYREGLLRLRQAHDQGHSVVLMCSEARPEMCHRSKLIGESLISMGIIPIHIDEDGKAISQEVVIDRITGGQLSIFESGGQTRTSRKNYKDRDLEQE